MAVPQKHGAAQPAFRRDLSTAPREVADPSDPREQRIALLRERLQAVLRDQPLSRARVGMAVMKASDGDVLFAHNANSLFNPASNTKMLTTAAAMAYLGADWRYQTTLYGPEPDQAGVVHGDVVLRGTGDPSLTSSDLAELARTLQARGVVRIEGDIYADSSYHDAEHKDTGLGEGAIIINRNTYSVRVRPGEVGHAAGVWVEPHVDLFGVESQATTVRGKRSRLKIDAYRKADKIIVTVRGRITENRDTYVDVRRLADGALLAGWILRGALNDLGVEVTGQVHSGSARGAALLAEHRSAPLGDVCKISNKPSNNFVAEAIYKTVGGELFGIPGTLAKGTRAIAEFLAANGVKAGNYRIINGSGLTHENRVTAGDLTRLLRAVQFDPALSSDFATSLAIGGVDGTIRNRFLGTDMVGLVRAKTGTLSGVSALSGYVGDKDDVLIFSILVEGFRNRRTNEVRHAQVRLVDAMMRFLRSDKTGPSAGEVNQPLPGDTTDSESDGDPQAP